jgi:hypothetical protein
MHGLSLIRFTIKNLATSNGETPSFSKYVGGAQITVAPFVHISREFFRHSCAPKVVILTVCVRLILAEKGLEQNTIVS